MQISALPTLSTSFAFLILIEVEFFLSLIQACTFGQRLHCSKRRGEDLMQLKCTIMPLSHLLANK